MGDVNYSTVVQVRLGEWLASKGYAIALTDGRNWAAARCVSSHDEQLGVLQGTERRGGLLGLFGWRRVVGCINLQWTPAEGRDLCPECRIRYRGVGNQAERAAWIVSIYGIDGPAMLFKRLLPEIATEFDVDIEARVTTTEEKREEPRMNLALSS